MIDTHCHLLHGIDDGPASLLEALDLARELVAQGVETVVATPHWSRRFPTTHAAAADAAGLLRDALRREDVALEVHVAAELTEVVAATRPLDEITERSIARRAVVVELLPDSLPMQTRAVLSRLAAAGLTAVLAHPERSRAVQADVAVLDELRAAGALVQIVAPSLTGRWGGAVESATWDILLGGRADLLASDAHDRATRPCELTDARELVVDRLGVETWHDLTRDAPARLLDAA